MEKINEAIARINPGRRVDMDKWCPFIAGKCMGEECNAFTPEFGINVVNQKEVDHYIKNGFNDWQKQIEREDWVLNTIIETPNLNIPDEKTYIFTRKNYRTFEGKFGRCLVGSK